MPGLLRGIARTAVVAGTATAVSNRVSRRQGGRWAEQEAQQQQAAAPAPAPAAPPPPPPPAPTMADDMSSRIDQLKELGALKEQGLLTEEEFAAQKSKLLGG
ncbi:SHOCT domain-containing protein [Streptomyces sp. NPDC059104]|uniref:SHOCT domain-containing protein n=1 Tax=Streptomyces sp. NPDC059104 TaxID=3346729 RepID=UPI0036A7271C